MQRSFLAIALAPFLFLAAGVNATGEAVGEPGSVDASSAAYARHYLGREGRLSVAAASLRFALPVGRAGKVRVSYGISWDAKPELRAVQLRASLQAAQRDATELASVRVRRPAEPEDYGWHTLLIDVPGDPDAQRSLLLAAKGEAAIGAAARWTRPVWIDSEPDPRPNLILISLDTLRADHLGLYGHRRATSPGLDRLAREGVVFDNAIASSNWTLPSHVSMFSGLHPTRHGLSRFGEQRISPELVLLPELLNEAGYETAAFAEGGWVAPRLGFEDGFDSFVGRGVVGKGRLSKNLTRVDSWLRDRGGGPFFLFLHTYEAHAPYQPSREYREAMAPLDSIRFSRAFREQDADALQRAGRVPPKVVENIRRLYDAKVLYIDTLLDRLWSTLRDHDLAQRTCVIVTSDHGEEFYEHGRFLHDTTGLYDTLIRVPLIFWCPQRFDAGKRVTDPVSHVDLLPTLAALAGSEAAAGDGVDLLPLLEGKISLGGRVTLSEVERSPAKPAAMQQGRMLAARSLRYKLLYSTWDQKFTLFDLDEDPTEQVDIARDRPEVVRRLKPHLQRAVALRPEHPPVPIGTPDQDWIERLRELGYLE